MIVLVVIKNICLLVLILLILAILIKILESVNPRFIESIDDYKETIGAMIGNAIVLYLSAKIAVEIKNLKK